MKTINRRARFDYDISEKIEAGIVLTGAEVKAVKENKVDFLGSFAKPVGGEIFLINLHIGAGEDTRRTRKLLLNKKEILNLTLKAKASKLTLIPLSLYTKTRKVKVELGLGRGKRKHEKRAELKNKDIEREILKELGT